MILLTLFTFSRCKQYCYSKKLSEDGCPEAAIYIKTFEEIDTSKDATIYVFENGFTFTNSFTQSLEIIGSSQEHVTFSIDPDTTNSSLVLSLSDITLIVTTERKAYEMRSLKSLESKIILPQGFSLHSHSYSSDLTSITKNIASDVFNVICTGVLSKNFDLNTNDFEEIRIAIYSNTAITSSNDLLKILFDSANITLRHIEYAQITYLQRVHILHIMKT